MTGQWLWWLGSRLSVKNCKCRKAVRLEKRHRGRSLACFHRPECTALYPCIPQCFAADYTRTCWDLTHSLLLVLVASRLLDRKGLKTLPAKSGNDESSME